jgi:hypothetical protein
VKTIKCKFIKDMGINKAYISFNFFLANKEREAKWQYFEGQRLLAENIHQLEIVKQCKPLRTKHTTINHNKLLSKLTQLNSQFFSFSGVSIYFNLESIFRGSLEMTDLLCTIDNSLAHLWMFELQQFLKLKSSLGEAILLNTRLNT